MKFHDVHGVNTSLDHSKRVAKRLQNSFCDSFVFSCHPLRINSSLVIRLTSNQTEWYGYCFLGLTSKNPANFIESVYSKHIINLLANNDLDVWIKQINEQWSNASLILTLNSEGQLEITTEFDTDLKQIFLENLPVNLPLWLVLDLYGRTNECLFPTYSSPNSRELVSLGCDVYSTFKCGENGIVPYNAARIILIGPKSSGKTRLKQMLNSNVSNGECDGENGNSNNNNNNNSMNEDVIYNYNMYISENNEWTLYNSSHNKSLVVNGPDKSIIYHEIAKNIVHEIVLTTSSNNNNSNGSDEYQFGLDSISSLSPKELIKNVLKFPKKLIPRPYSKEVRQLSENLNEIPDELILMIEEQLKQIPKDHQITHQTNPIVETNNKKQRYIINICDFSGNLLYLIINQFFFTNCAVYIFVFNLADDLMQSKSDQYENISCIGEIGNQPLSSLQLMHLWISLIHSTIAGFPIPNETVTSSTANTSELNDQTPTSTSKKDEFDLLQPQIVLVGTHRNSVHAEPITRNQIVKEIFDKIHDSFDGKSYAGHLFPEHVALDSNEMSFDEPDLMNNLRRMIESLIQEENLTGFSIPMCWMQLDQILEKFRQRGIYFVDIYQLHEVVSSQIDEFQSYDNLYSALLFYQNQGRIFYLDCINNSNQSIGASTTADGINDRQNSWELGIIILDPNWFINCIYDLCSYLSNIMSNKIAAATTTNTTNQQRQHNHNHHHHHHHHGVDQHLDDIPNHHQDGQHHQQQQVIVDDDDNLFLGIISENAINNAWSNFIDQKFILLGCLENLDLICELNPYLAMEDAPDVATTAMVPKLYFFPWITKPPPVPSTSSSTRRNHDNNNPNDNIETERIFNGSRSENHEEINQENDMNEDDYDESTCDQPGSHHNLYNNHSSNGNPSIGIHGNSSIPTEMAANDDDGNGSLGGESTFQFVINFSILPLSLFTRLLIRLSKWSWNQGWGRKPEMYNCKGRVAVDFDHDIILKINLLQDRIYLIIVKIFEEIPSDQIENLFMGPAANVCVKVQHLIENELGSLKNSYYRRLSYNLAIPCPCDAPCERHKFEGCLQETCLHFLNLHECLQKKVVECRFNRQIRTAFIQRFLPYAPTTINNDIIYDSIFSPSPTTTTSMAPNNHGTMNVWDNVFQMEQLWMREAAKMLLANSGGGNSRSNLGGSGIINNQSANTGSNNTDWVSLAKRLSYTERDIMKFNTELSPPLALLKDWYESNGRTRYCIDVLISCLRMLSRDDIASLIEYELEPESVSPPIFLSYQHDSQKQVLEIRRKLELSGFPCWMDTRSISGGDSLYGKIYEGISRAKVFVCCLTPRYVASPMCNREVALADVLHKPILPLIIEFTPWPPPGAMALIMSSIVYVDLCGVGSHHGTGRTQDTESRFREILDHISRYISGYNDTPFASSRYLQLPDIFHSNNSNNNNSNHGERSNHSRSLLGGGGGVGGTNLQQHYAIHHHIQQQSSLMNHSHHHNHNFPHFNQRISESSSHHHRSGNNTMTMMMMMVTNHHHHQQQQQQHHRRHSDDSPLGPHIHRHQHPHQQQLSQHQPSMMLLENDIEQQLHGSESMHGNSRIQSRSSTPSRPSGQMPQGNTTTGATGTTATTSSGSGDGGGHDGQDGGVIPFSEDIITDDNISVITRARIANRITNCSVCLIQ